MKTKLCKCKFLLQDEDGNFNIALTEEIEITPINRENYFETYEMMIEFFNNEEQRRKNVDSNYPMRLRKALSVEILEDE